MLQTRVHPTTPAVYLSGREAFLNLSSDPHATMRPEWGRWCEAVHQGEWQYKFWTEQAAVELLERVRRQGWAGRNAEGHRSAVAVAAAAAPVRPPLSRRCRLAENCRSDIAHIRSCTVCGPATQPAARSPHPPSHLSRDWPPQHYAWFLPTWHSYKEIVKKGDALRYFLME